MNPAEIVKRYVGDLTRVLGAIDPGEIQGVIDALESARTRQARVFVIGNGGSAATASHLCTDLGVGLRRRGLVGFDICSLTDNASIATAVANDGGYEDVFSAQLEGVIGPDDVLIAISASGNSPNILNAVCSARTAGATVIGCSGFDGGELKRTADVSFYVPTAQGAYGLVEDAHMVLNHILHTYFVSSVQSEKECTMGQAGVTRERLPAHAGAGSGWVRLDKAKERRKWQPTPTPPSS